ncbi:MAG: hypothetical protein WEA10_02670 [Actinomycetota bacterium]
MDDRHRQALLAGTATSVVVALMGFLFFSSNTAEVVAPPSPGPEVTCEDWHAVAAGDLGVGASALHDVAGLRPTDVWAVGSRANEPLVLHAVDGEWQTVVPALKGVRGSTELTGIDVLASDDVWAVGTSRTAKGQTPLVLHWDGETWNRQTLARQTPSDAALLAVDATKDEVVVVGGTGDVVAGTGEPVIESFGGRRWVLERPDSQTGVLRDVLIDDRGRVVAAGFRGDPAELVSIPFAEVRDGRRFREFLAEERARNALYSVDAGPGEDPWVLGTMAALFDGRGFERVTVALAGTSILDAVQTTPRRADAVGVRTTQGGPRPVFAKWTGKTWEPVKEPATSEIPGSLEGLMLARNGQGWAVGTRETQEGGTALVLRKGC